MLRLIQNRRSSRLAFAAAVTVALLVCCDSSLADETVNVCGSSYGNHVFVPAPVPGIGVSAPCPSTTIFDAGLQLFTNGDSSAGAVGRWQAVAPTGLELLGASAIGIYSYAMNDGQGYGGGFYWGGGGIRVGDTTPNNVGMLFSSPSSHFGMQLICGWATCGKGTSAQFGVTAFALYVRETIGPSFAAPTGLWRTSGWVRGIWPFFLWGNSPSGLCWLSARLNGQLINTTTSQRDVSQWHQCAAPPISQPVDTSRFGQGAVTLSFSTGDAAGVPASISRIVHIDNSTPAISMSGPTDAASTAGIQHVTVSAGGSPSGIAHVVCTVDGGHAQTYARASALVPVGGIGEHTVGCYATNNAVDPSGVHGRSPTDTWSLKIGQPTVVGIAFDKLVGLRCHRTRVRVKIPARRSTNRTQTRLEHVVRCHPHTIRRRTVVLMRVRRHGRIVTVKRIQFVRVVIPPRVVAESSRVVAFGHGSTVNGWLGTATGTAMSGHTVRVFTAPDNGGDHFTQAAAVTTNANGSWTAQLPPGSSRVVEAEYDGDPTTEGAWSGQVHLIVPAKVKLLRVSPTRVPWGGTVRITGQLLGGYLPPGGALVRLRIGFGSAYTTYGVQEHVTGNGRFTTRYTFGLGDPSVRRTYWFQIASLPMGNYPFAPAASGRRSVTVGGHP